jgi:26S proteasome regulatory subunit N8
LQGKENVRTFVHIPCEVGAYEAEEVGVEFLLRGINDPSVSSTAGELRHKLAGLRGLRSNLGEIGTYLAAVTEGKLPANREILYHVQTLLAHLPNTQLPEVVDSLYESVNDQHLVIYVASLTRAVLALHDLLNNKAKYKALEEGAENGEEKKDKEKAEGDEKEGKKGEGKDKDTKKGDESKGASKKP